MPINQQLEGVLDAVRQAMLAVVHNAPPLPALLVAEERILRLMFTPAEVDDYLASKGAKIYGR